MPTLIIPGPALIPKSSPSVKRKRLLQGLGFSLPDGRQAFGRGYFIAISVSSATA